METVFSTLRPASPALSKPHQVSVSRSGEEEAIPFLVPTPHSSFLLSYILPLILLSLLFSSLPFVLRSLLWFHIKRTPVCLLRLTLFVAKLDIIQVTEGAALWRLLNLFPDRAVLTGCCLSQFI